MGVLLIYGVLAVLPGCDAASHDLTPSAGLTRMLLHERFTVGRLAGQEVWQPCIETDEAALVPRAACARSPQPDTRRFEQITDAVRAARSELQSDSSAPTLRAGALVDIRFSDANPAGLDRAAEALERARRAAPEDAILLNDLAVVYLELGERDQQLMPMLRALEVSERAVAADSTLRTALFNRALVLERLYLWRRARKAWARYLAVEPDSAWRAEARTRLRGLQQRSDRASLPERSWIPSQPLTRFDPAGWVRRSPQAARDSAFSLLREWGIAVVHSDHARADQILAFVQEMSVSFAEQDGDRSVELALVAIDASKADLEKTRRLAQTHIEFSRGVSLYARAAYDDAFPVLTNVAQSLQALGSPAARWAAFYSAAAEVNRGHYTAADTILHALLAVVTSAEPALVGKATWALGVSQLRRGRYENATRLYRDAARQMARAREPENEGAISYLLTESLHHTGQVAAGRAEAYRGLRLLAPFGSSFYLNNHLTTVASYARAYELSHAARAVMDEVLEVAPSTNMPQLVAWAFRARARDQISLGHMGAARSDVADAMRWADRITPGRGRDRVWADVALVRAELILRDDPLTALSLLTKVVDTYRRLGVSFQVPAAEYQTSRAALALGQRHVAQARLKSAIEEIEKQQASNVTAEARSAFYETVENVFDAMIASELASGRPAAAFEILERGRVALRPTQRGSEDAVSAQPVRTTIRETVRRIPHDMLLVEYALLDDRLVIWTISKRGWRHHSLLVKRDTIAALADRFLQEANSAEVGGGSAGARLFEVLILPIASDLAGVRRLAIVPDRDLYRVPFAALWNQAERRYLLEDHQLRTVPSAGFLLAAVARSSTIDAGPEALVVGNPTLDPVFARELPSLAGAENEARGVARLYPRARLMQRAAAGRGAVLEVLPGASVFHFAGHAVFNNEQPELSYIALSPDRAGDSGLLYAWEIGALRLSNLRVVILSACSSLSPRPSRSGVLAGLAYSFLRAGAPATVSTLWDVSDQTTSELLLEFHRHFARGTPAPEALRLAQIELLKSPDGALNTPRAWAAFTYTGP